MQNVLRLSLNNNLLTGLLPQTIGYMDRLQVLDLSHNGFEGSIPDGFDILHIAQLHLEANPGLSSPACTLPSFFSASFAVVSHNLDGHFSCPSLSYTGIPESVVFVDPQCYCNSLCLCDVNYFGANGVCSPCPDHAFCKSVRMQLTARPVAPLRSSCPRSSPLAPRFSPLSARPILCPFV
jgi:hypothetical protein